MKKLLIYLIMIGCLLISSTDVFSFTKWTGTEYMVNEDTITFVWDAVSNTDRYEVKVIWIDPTNHFEYDLGSTTGTQIVITRPRTGHLVFAVRACNDVECSEWSESIDMEKATVDGEPESWRVYWKVPPPGGIIIE